MEPITIEALTRSYKEALKRVSPALKRMAGVTDNRTQQGPMFKEPPNFRESIYESNRLP